jgi:hypothetical protein
VKSQILKLSNPFKFNSNHIPKRFKPEKIKTKLFLESGPISSFHLVPPYEAHFLGPTGHFSFFSFSSLSSLFFLPEAM